MFSRRTNRTSEARVYSHDGPVSIRRSHCRVYSHPSSALCTRPATSVNTSSCEVSGGNTWSKPKGCTDALSSRLLSCSTDSQSPVSQSVQQRLTGRRH
eukprot:5935537-Pyramimonas_sp.AAC.1